jgi:hypothetical protein
MTAKNKTRTLLPALLILGAAGGCTRPAGLAPLDRPATVTASGAQTQSQITIFRKGVLDPTGSLTTLQVKDASLRMVTTDDHATVEELVLKLADANLAPTEAMPEGVNLRQQELRIIAPVKAPMVQREANALTVRAHASLQYRAALVLDDGSLYTLGATQTEVGDMDLRATRYEFGVHVTLDAAPQGKCWSIPGVIDVSDCSLYVETDGDAYAD